MKFTEVAIANFLAIGEAKFSLDQLGLVHIAGENLDETSADSNGSGKSSLGDAISWCLWGNTARGIGGDDVVNTAAGKGCCVSITIDDAGDQYRIVRHRKDGKHKNAVELFQLDVATGAWEERTKGTNALTQAAIERLLGCSEEVFNAAVYSGQENIPDIPRMTDRQLKILVEQAAGVDVLTNAYEIARAQLRDAQAKRADAQFALDAAQQRHDDSNASMMRLSDDKTRWDTQQKTKIENLKIDTTRQLTEYKQAEAAFDQGGEKLVRDGIADCESKIASVNAERQRESVLNGDVSQATATHSRAHATHTVAERGGQDAARAYREAQKELEDAKTGVGKPCPSCARPLDGSHLQASIKRAQTKVDAAKDKVQAAAKALVEAKAKLTAASEMVGNANTALEDHQKGMTDVSAEGDRLRNLQRELQVIAAHRQEIDRLRVKATNTANDWKREAAMDNPFIDTIEQEEKRLIDRAKAVNAAEAARKAAMELENYAQAVSDVFAPAGVRAHRLDEATPYLNERTAHYLGSLADGAIEAFWTTISENKAKDKLVERFSVTVEKQGSAPSFNALSGGEKRKVRLSCALALQDLVATRAAKNIELMVLDEIDDALDASGLERLMGVLEEKARDRGTLLIISHNDIAAFARRTMTVTKQGGRAEVTMN